MSLGFTFLFKANEKNIVSRATDHFIKMPVWREVTFFLVL